MRVMLDTNILVSAFVFRSERIYRDISDAPILYTAITEGIDVLITGDKDFHDIDIEMPAIMTVTNFINRYM